jgi:acid phosphatase type 7
MRQWLVAGTITAILAACGSSAQGPNAGRAASPEPPSGRVAALASTSPSPSPAPTAVRDPVLYAVGDIASCAATTDEKVADLLRGRRGRIALLGDVVYDRGTASEYRRCFDPAWGPMGRRLRPAPGNHDYLTPDAAGYFGYFGRRAGAAGKGWYSYDLGAHWRVVVLNSECARVGGCTRSSPQGRWLHRTLSSAGDRHVLAYWHVPLFSTGRHGGNAAVRPLWRQLHAAGAALILNGHDHIYERFAPQDPAGRPDPSGPRQFTVGTGGFTLYDFRAPPARTTEARGNTSFGVLRLRLEPDGYRWRFIPATGDFTDRGRHRLR